MFVPRPVALALALSTIAFASQAAAQDTFQQMNAGYHAAMGTPANSPPSPVLRVGAEFLVGGLAGAVGGGAGLLGGGLACGFEALDNQLTATASCRGRLPVGIFAPAFVGATLLTAVAVPLMGDRYGGRGAWWGSALGALAGSAGGLAIVSSTELDWRTSSLIYIGTTTVGAIIGYELSAAAAPSTLARNGLRVTPVATVTPGGAQFGVAGVF